MKFYGAMGGVLFLDLLVFWVLAHLYVPAHGSHALVVMRRGFFLPILVVSALQIVKLFLNISRGYVVSIQGIKLIKSTAADAPFGFLFGVALELGIWGLLGIIMFKVLMHT
ncbi:hypothetical protein [Rhodanobacter spathiphylli]|uniref:hypothetical protein n=1 Tax=Rhodanobacter spathiphylli TaxID=347483 RepID=UPI0012FA3940|nr:hypothetical protein [Rhodanobacter spathiphylli]